MFAGHGYNWVGRQCLATNKFDFRENYYELILVEQYIRSCINLPNVYFFVIFACCRETLSVKDPVIKTIPEMPLAFEEQIQPELT